MGLRVSELCGLNLETTDLARGTTWIQRQCRKEKELVPPATVVAALRRYLVARLLNRMSWVVMEPAPRSA